MHTKGCTLLIATYNYPRALEMCLLSLQAQTIMPNEIVIADDGSTMETKNLIAEYKKIISIPIKHVWHNDVGYRKTIILNEAIRLSEYPYIIQIDGDIIMHKKFIQEHLQSAQPKHFIRGSRVLITEELTKQYIDNKKINLRYYSKGVLNRFNGFHSKLISKIIYAISNKKSPLNVIGCNTAFYKDDFIAVNGFNNDITGWGREDGELASRLINTGVLKKQVKNMAIAYHMYHTFYSRDKDVKNIQLFKATVEKKIIFCANGYNQKKAVEIV